MDADILLHLPADVLARVRVKEGKRGIPRLPQEGKIEELQRVGVIGILGKAHIADVQIAHGCGLQHGAGVAQLVVGIQFDLQSAVGQLLHPLDEIAVRLCDQMVLIDRTGHFQYVDFFSVLYCSDHAGFFTASGHGKNHSQDQGQCQHFFHTLYLLTCSRFTHGPAGRVSGGEPGTMRLQLHSPRSSGNFLYGTLCLHRHPSLSRSVSL